MHPNPVFRKKSNEDHIAFTQKRSFGILAVNGDNGPLLSHIPFQLSKDGRILEAHIVRSNPIARLDQYPVPAVMAISGGDGYISPDWYQVDDQVPTWNYVAVHLRGQLHRCEADALHGILERLSNNMETRLKPKPIWTTAKMNEQAYHKMLRQIIPIKMKIEDIQGTWKLSQNKPKEARMRAAQQLQTSPIGMQLRTLAKLMAQQDI